LKRSVYGQTILLCSLFLFGCKVRQQESDAKLVGGELVASDQAFPATVRINEKCTAARIGQASFLLAAHCFFQNPDRRVFNMVPGGKMNIGKGVKAATRFKLFEIDQVAIHPQYLFQMRHAAQSLPGLFQQLNQNPGNQALIDSIFNLDTNVPQPNVPDVAVLSVKLTPEHVAFLSSVAIAKISTNTLQPQSQDLLIGGYGCTSTFGQDGGLLHAAVLKRGDYRLENAFFFKKKDIVQGCAGDSGGPVYLKQSPPMTVVGINSFVSDHADSWTAFSRLDQQSPGEPASFLRKILPAKTFTSGGVSGTTSTITPQPVKPDPIVVTPPPQGGSGGGSAGNGSFTLHKEFNGLVGMMIELNKAWTVTNQQTFERVMEVESLSCTNSGCLIESKSFKNNTAVKLKNLLLQNGQLGATYQLRCLIAFGKRGMCVFTRR
jgi:hypothetical protein